LLLIASAGLGLMLGTLLAWGLHLLNGTRVTADDFA
jgi:hypothetical protein